MSSRIRTYIRQNHLALLTLFLVLSGGTAYAVDGSLEGQNTVGSADIINGEVLNADLGPDAVGTGKVIDDALQSRDVLDETLQARDLGAASVGTAEVADDDLTAGDLAIGSVGTAEVADDAVRSFDVLNSSLLGADIANSSLTGLDVAFNSLTGADIDESTLGTVPNASTLDGMDSARFVQGQSGGGGSVSLGRQVQPAGGGSRILLRGLLGTLNSTCQSDGDAVLTYVNSLASPLVDIGDNVGGNTEYTNVATGDSRAVLDAQSAAEVVGQVQVHTAASTTGPQQAATFLVSVQAAFNSSDDCKFFGQVVTANSP